jgi:ribose-phosphate pyrophosphokinase
MSYKVFASERYEYLKAQMCSTSDFTPGGLHRASFADGERHLRFDDDLHGKDVVLIGGTIDDAATLELYDMALGLIGLGIHKLSLVIPYFGYSTQERAVKRGEVVTAKARAVLLSAIPRARMWNEVLLVDLHTPGIAHYFEGHLHSVQLSALPIALGIVQQASAHDSAVVACTDAGRAKWVQALANQAKLPAAFVYKSRQEDGRTAVTGVNADVKGKHVIIYDDMVRSGGSLIEAGQAYAKAGAAKITAIVTHAVLPGDSLRAVRDSGLFTALHCTDTHPRAVELVGQSGGFLKVHPIAGLLQDYLMSELRG